MTEQTQDPGLNRRKLMKCMMWGSAGVLWTMSGGVPRSFRLDGEALAATPQDFSFVQISDTHIGFKGAVNPEPGTTLKNALGRVAGAKPAFLVHTGDVSHLSKAEEFDAAAELMKG